MRRTDGDDGDDYMDLRPKRIRADLDQIRAQLGQNVTHGALHFALRHPAVTGAIVGVRNEREARDVSALPVPVLDVPERPEAAGIRLDADEA